MSKSIREEFSDFRSRHGLSLHTIRQIAEDYAFSPFACARSYFCEKYEISEYVFYKCRDFAVIFGLVKDSTCNVLQQKASNNSSIHNNSASCRKSLNHFNKLLQRREIVLNSFTTEEKSGIGSQYARNISLEEISQAYGIGIYSVKKLLERGILDLSIDDETLERIIQRLASQDKSKKFIDNLLLKRKKYTLRQPIWHFSDTLGRSLSFIINNYDVYFAEDSNPPSIDELKLLLEIAKKKYKEACQL